MREPSIHITKSTLEELMVEICSYSSNGAKRFSEVFMKKAAKKAITGRGITITNDKIERDLKRRVATTKGDTDLLANIIYSVRIKKKHRGIRQMTQDDRDWLQLKGLTKVCNQFCNEFEIDKREGYIKYVEIGLSKISSMHSYIAKLTNMYEAICNDYAGISELTHDTNKSGTMAMHDFYCETVSNKSGIPNDFTNRPDKMMCFMKAREIADEYNCNYEDYIEAQFEALEFCNGIPTVEQLYGDKAIERLSKYLYKTGTKVRSNASQDVWKQFKKK